MNRPNAAVARRQPAGRPARQRDVRHDPSATQRPIAYATLLNSAPAVKTRRFSTACYGPKQEEASKVVAVAKALVDGARKAGVKRVVVVGGAGTLEVAPGKQLVDTEGFPDAYKAVALAHRDAYGYLSTVRDLDWTFFSPAALIAPGERTGRFRTGAGRLIVDEQGNSKISAEDYAIAFVDEIEQGRFIRQAATAAY
ncbi:NAD-dependent epimerase/dehydratase family protein [Burkholderia pseudomallei]|nr:NAD-dependent epimerase/dehydratase family protein [Burkholderia pseudomallei]